MVEGFHDSKYDARDNCGGCLGVYFCTHPNLHHPCDTALIQLQLPLPFPLAVIYPCAAGLGSEADCIIPAAALAGLELVLLK